MSDTAKRLRAQCDYYGHAQPPDARRAADELDALAARVAALEATLRAAHEELTNAGHQELPECECRVATVIRGTAETEAKHGA